MRKGERVARGENEEGTNTRGGARHSRCAVTNL